MAWSTPLTHHCKPSICYSLSSRKTNETRSNNNNDNNSRSSNNNIIVPNICTTCPSFQSENSIRQTLQEWSPDTD